MSRYLISTKMCIHALLGQFEHTENQFLTKGITGNTQLNENGDKKTNKFVQLKLNTVTERFVIILTNI